MTKFAYLSSSAIEGRGNSREKYLEGYCTVVQDGITYSMLGEDLRAFRRARLEGLEDAEIPNVYRFIRVVDADTACFATVGPKRAKKIVSRFLSKKDPKYHRKIPPKTPQSEDKIREVEPYDRTRVQKISDYMGRTSENGDLVQITIGWDAIEKTFVVRKKYYLKLDENRCLIKHPNALPQVFSLIDHDFDEDAARIAPVINRRDVWKLLIKNRAVRV